MAQRDLMDNGMEFTSKVLVEWAAPGRQARSHAAGQASMKSNHSFHVVASCGILTFWHRRKCDQQIHNYTGAGQVAGRYRTEKGQYHAFITGPDGAAYDITDLGSVVNPPPGFTHFSNATAINNHGQLVAVGTLVPEPEMYSMLLLGLGLIGFFARGRATA